MRPDQFPSWLKDLIKQRCQARKTFETKDILNDLRDEEKFTGLYYAPSRLNLNLFLKRSGFCRVLEKRNATVFEYFEGDS